MAAFAHHVFVCCNQRAPGHPRGCCDPDGSEKLCNALRAELSKHSIPGLVRVNKCGCLDQCELGPTVVIYPQAIWYGRVQITDVSRIVTETILHGRLLPDLLIAEHRLNAKRKA
jgi:(2Fe-2S) ferredoxin